MSTLFTKIVVPVVAILGLLLLLAWQAGVFTDKLAPGLSAHSTAITADTVAVVRREHLIFEPVAASIQAKQATNISSRILSRIEKIHVRAGDTVIKGQLLVELEKADLRSRVSQAEANTNAVTARLTEATQSLQRATALAETKVISKADVDKARSNYNALAAELVSAEQASSEAKARLGYANILAPISGRIIDRFAEPGDTAQPGVQLLSLYNPLSLRVEANVREQLALSLVLEQALEVSIPATNDTVWAVVEELVPAGNLGSRSFMVKSRLPYSTGLLPGLYAQIKVPAGRESILLVPNERVAQVGQLDVVWVVNAGAAERRFIRTGKAMEGGLIEVISGLDEGDQVLPVQIEKSVP